LVGAAAARELPIDPCEKKSKRHDPMPVAPGSAGGRGSHWRTISAIFHRHLLLRENREEVLKEDWLPPKNPNELVVNWNTHVFDKARIVLVLEQRVKQKPAF
jgi:hypothetical protein